MHTLTKVETPHQEATGFFLSFFLYLSFISGISPIHVVIPSIEHFPYGILLVLLFARIPPAAALTTYIILTMFIASTLYYSGSGEGIQFKFLIQLLNFTAPLFYFRGNEQIFARVARNVFWIYITVGLLQMAHIMLLFEPLFDVLISRFSGAPLGGYRGVTMLETEPARAGFQLLMLYLVASFRQSSDWLMWSALVLAQVIMISSTTGILVTAMYFGISWGPRLIKKPWTLIIPTILLALSFDLIIEQPKIAILWSLYQSNGLDGAVTALAATSGGRFLAITNAISEIFQWPFGYGVDPSFFSAETFEVNGYQIDGYVTRTGARPNSPILVGIRVFGLALLIPLWLSIKYAVGRSKFGAKAIAILLIGVLYTPAGSEIWLIAFMLSISSLQTITKNETFSQIL